jgi:hypothetical protein
VKQFALRLTRGGRKEDIQELRQLAFSGQSANFTVGNTIVGGTSGARGRLISQSDAGATGTLVLDKVTGNFQNGEALTDAPGAGNGTANGTLAIAAVTPTDQAILLVDAALYTRSELLAALRDMQAYVQLMPFPDR